MKLFAILAVAIFVAPIFSHAQEENNAEASRELLAQSAKNCGSGTSGWWVQLNSNALSTYLQGGISRSTGAFYGCGSCPECRVKLNNEIDATLAVYRKSCTDRGGVVKSETRGTWDENIRPDQWLVRTSGATVVCEKWLSCN